MSQIFDPVFTPLVETVFGPLVGSSDPGGGGIVDRDLLLIDFGDAGAVLNYRANDGSVRYAPNNILARSSDLTTGSWLVGSSLVKVNENTVRCTANGSRILQLFDGGAGVRHLAIVGETYTLSFDYEITDLVQRGDFNPRYFDSTAGLDVGPEVTVNAVGQTGTVEYTFTVQDTSASQIQLIRARDTGSSSSDFRGDIKLTNLVVSRGSEAYPSVGSRFDQVFRYRTKREGVSAVRDYAGNVFTGGYQEAQSVTQQIQDNTGVTAVAGFLDAGGALPTGWSATDNITTAEVEVVGSGTEDGINYVDVRIARASASAGFNIHLRPGTGASAAVGDDWTAFSYVRLVAGAFTNVSSLVLRAAETNAGGGTLVASTVDLLTPAAGANLKDNVAQVTREFSNGSVANARASVNCVTSGAVDFTLRVGLPSLTQQSFAPQPIKTFGAEITKAVDEWENAGPLWFLNNDKGTVVLRGVVLDKLPSGAKFFTFDAGAASNKHDLILPFNSNNAQSRARDGVAAETSFFGTGATITVGDEFEIAYTWDTVAQVSTIVIASVTSTGDPHNLPDDTITTFSLGSDPFFTSTAAFGWDLAVYIPGRALTAAEIDDILGAL